MRPCSTLWNDCRITVVARSYMAGQRSRPVGRGPENAKAVTIQVSEIYEKFPVLG